MLYNNIINCQVRAVHSTTENLGRCNGSNTPVVVHVNSAIGYHVATAKDDEVISLTRPSIH